MKKPTLKVLSILLTITMIFSVVPLTALDLHLPALAGLFRTVRSLAQTAKASDYLTSGYCGDTSGGKDGTDIAWSLDNEGVLTLTGTGPMGSTPNRADNRVTKLIVGEGITSLSASAFSGCNALSSAELPQSLKTIGNYAFQNDDALISVSLGGVESIGISAFQDSGLTSVSLPSTLKSLGTSAFRSTPLSSVSIPSSVETFSSSVFYGCGSLTSISVNCSTIGDYAFYSTGLRSFNPSSSVKTIGSYAFANCGNLQNVYLRDVTDIGEKAFYNCTALTSSVNLKNCKTVGNDAFSGTLISSLEIGSSVTSFGVQTEMTSATAISIPTLSLRFALSDGVLYTVGYKKILIFPKDKTSLSLPNGFPLMEENIFREYRSVETYSVSDDCENYKTSDGILYSKDGKTLIACPPAKTGTPTLLKTTQTIGKWAFLGSQITSVTIPPASTLFGNPIYALKEIGYGAFQSSKIESFPFPSSLKTIQTRAFYFSKLKQATLPSGIALIGQYAFGECHDLESASIPAGVISDYAFISNHSLSSLNIGSGVTEIGNQVFSSASNLTGALVIPDGCTKVGNNAFQETGFTSIHVGSGTTSFGKQEMPALTTITLASENTNFRVYDNVLYTSDYSAVVLVPIKDEIRLPNAFPFQGDGTNILADFTTVKRVTVSSSHPSYQSIDGVLYSKNGTILYFCPRGRTEKLTVAPGTTTIFQSACRFSSIPEIEFPASVRTIGEYAVASTAITSLTVPATVNTVEANAFAHCKNLISIDIAAKNILGNAFYCSAGSKVTTVHINEGVESIGAYAFSEMHQVTELTLPSTLRLISSFAFKEMYKLPVLNLPENLTTIGLRAFEDLDSVKTLTIPASVRSIEYGAFYNCSQLQSVTLNEGLETIGQRAFYNCRSLSAPIVIPNSCVSVGRYAFRETRVSDITSRADVQKLDLAAKKILLEGGLFPIRTDGKDFNDYTLNTLTVEGKYTSFVGYDTLYPENDDSTVCGYCGSPAHELAIKRLFNFESLGHTWLDWYVYEPATYDNDGVERRDCAYCDGFEERVIPKLERETFTATFAADGRIVSQVDFQKDATSVEEPSVPAKDRYTGKWEDYTLNNADITINAEYTLITSGDVSEIETDADAVHYIDDDNVLFRMSAYSAAKTVKSVVSQTVPLDIVLVVDQSGSMDETLGGNVKKVDALKSAAHEFVDAVAANAALTGADHRIAVVGFGLAGKHSGYLDNENTELLTSGQGIVPFAQITPADYASALISIQNKATLDAAVDSIEARGATAADLGLEMAKGVFANTDSSDRDRVVIFMTDGAPTYQLNFQSAVANSAVANARLLKSTYGALVYSVGIFSSEDARNGNINRFMQAVSSNYPNARSCTNTGAAEANSFFTTVDDTAALSGVFRTITTESLSHTASFDNVTLIKTLSKYVTLTAPQEQTLRVDAIRKYGISNDQISVTRNADGTTAIRLDGLTPYEAEKDGDVIYEVSLEFFASLNEKAAAAADYTVDSEDSGVMLGDAVGYEATFGTSSITLSEAKTRYLFTINGQLYEISEGSSISEATPETSFAADWQFSGWDTAGIDSVNGVIVDATLVKAPRTVTWHTADGDVSQIYREGEFLSPPTVSDRADGSKFLSWNRSLPTVMPDEDLEFTAVYGEHVHKYISEDEVPASCTADGTRRYTCICGDSYTESLPATGHSFEAIAPSSEQDASRCTFVCGNCGARYEYALDYEIKVNTNYGRSLSYEFQLTDDDLNFGFEPDGSIDISIPLSEFQNGARSVRVTRTVNGVKENVPVRTENGFLIITANHFTPYDIDFVFDCGETGEHTWDEGTETKTATCKEPGERLYQCQFCSETKTEFTQIDPNNHADYGTETENAVAATCCRDGYTGDTVCAGCKTIFSHGETISMQTVPHTWNAGTETVAPTCKTIGEKTYTCTITGCNATKTENVSVNPLNHADYGTEQTNAVAATCCRDGYTGDIVCAGCGAILNEGETISKDTIPHTWDEGLTTLAPTCSVKGEKTFVCTVTDCGATREEEIPLDADNHADYGEELRNAVSATCHSDGYSGDLVCIGCQAILTPGETISKDTVAHTWNNGEVTLAATCSETGTRLYTCSVEGCGATTEEEIPFDTDNHADYGEMLANVVAATCHSDGYTGDTVCAGCGHVFTAGEIISKNTVAHTWNNGEVTKPATCAETGTRLYTCSAEGCGATREETIDLDSDNHADYGQELVNAENASCYKDGYTGDLVCAGCGYVFSTGEIISKDTVPHAWDAGEVIVKPTCSNTGTMLYRCTVKSCGATKEREIKKDPNAHVYKVTVIEPTCTEGGYTNHACTLCRYGYSDNETDALGHAYGIRITPPTCTEGGITTCKCVRCGNTFTKDPTDPMGHTDGNGDGRCDVCNAVLDPSAQESNCVCGGYHTGPFAGILRFFHTIVYFFKNLFNR